MISQSGNASCIDCIYYSVLRRGIKDSRYCCCISHGALGAAAASAGECRVRECDL
jgi:hypothetical protein